MMIGGIVSCTAAPGVADSGIKVEGKSDVAGSLPTAADVVVDVMAGALVAFC
jgi:hypothetical protein